MSEDWVKELGEVAREEAREVDVWWDAAERGDVSLLPSGTPPIVELRPIDAQERARVLDVLLERPAAPIPLRRPRRMWVAGAAAMAIAAAVAAIALRAPPASLPSYSMTVSAGDRTWRSSEAPSPTPAQYRSGSRLELVLQPENAVETAPDVSAELVGKRTLVWPTPIERGRDGAFRMLADIGSELGLEPGPWRVVVLIGRPPNSVQRLEYKFEVVDGP